MTNELKNLKVGHRNIRITVGEYTIFIGYKITGEEALKRVGVDRLAWLDSHNPIHVYYSMEEIEYVYRANKKYNKLCK